MEELHEVVIVGAGIAGLATAVALKRVGIPCLVLERSHELRATGAALTLLPNAWRALDALGVATKLTPIYDAFQKSHVTNISNGATQEMSLIGSTQSDLLGVRSVHRKALLEALAEELPPNTIRFSSKLASIKTQILKDSSTLQALRFENGSVIKTKILIGCDGVHSMVAQWLGLSPPVDSGRAAVRAIAVFPEGHGFKHEVQQFVAPGKRGGFVPLNKTELFWFITHESSSQENIVHEPEFIQKNVLETLAKDFPGDYINVVQHTDMSTLSWARLLYRRPWDLILGHTHKDGVVVAGDAMHPMTPDLAQGGCSALEDAVVLGRSIGNGRSGKGVREGIEVYVKERRWRVAGLITGAYLSGMVQQGGSGLWGWALGWFRDHVFYRFVFPVIMDAVNYDCGVLPTVK